MIFQCNFVNICTDIFVNISICGFCRESDRAAFAYVFYFIYSVDMWGLAENKIYAILQYRNQKYGNQENVFPKPVQANFYNLSMFL